MTLRLAPLWWSMGAALVVIDLYFCLAPPSAGAGLLPDKLAHFSMYFALCGWFASLKPQRLLSVFVAVLALGGLIELLQGLTSYRTADWQDMLANASGALSALVVVQQLPFNAFAWFERVIGVRREA